MATTDPVLVETRGPLGVITLNRPRALNALSLEMIGILDPLLRRWATDPAIRAVVVRGAGDRAFCAGGDLHTLYEAGAKASAMVAEHPERDFFRREYVLNWRIHHFPKPYIALIDGVVMGGGIGLSVHGSHRVATERTLFAMPECGIGLFPDVGGGWFLAHCPGEVGVYLGLTGYRGKAPDALYAGIATHYLPTAALEAVVDDLAAADWQDDASVVVDRILAAHEDDPGAAPLAAARPAIDRHFAFDRVEAILDSLAIADDDWAATARTDILRGSPTSLKVTLRQLRLCRDLDYDTCVTVEYRLSQACLAGHDLFEGIRAVVVDKDRTPRWRPAELAAVDDATVDRYFAPLGGRDLAPGSEAAD